MWGGLDARELDDALDFRLRNPRPAPAREPSFWSKVGEVLQAVPKGAAQAVNESLRVANRVGSIEMAQDSPKRRAERGDGPIELLFPGSTERIARQREEALARRQGYAQEADTFLRDAIEYWKPDPVSSSTASQILHGAARVIGKVLVYGGVGGAPGMVVGTGVDEGVTGYLELRDKGVDPNTATRAGVVRGASVAAGVALPAAAATRLGTAGLALAGGPGAFMAEQALTREILRRAEYPELAAEYDPFDPVGLGVSLAFGGAAGVIAHRARARRAAESVRDTSGQTQNADSRFASEGPEPDPVRALADDVQIRDAAHLRYADQVHETHILADAAEPSARAAHLSALQEAARAMDEGSPVHVPHVDVMPERAQRVMGELMTRLREVETVMAAMRAEDGSPAVLPPLIDAPPPVRAEVDGRFPLPDSLDGAEQSARTALTAAGLSREDGGQPAAVLRRAEEAIAQRPDLPVRLDADGPALAARDVLEQVRRDTETNQREARGFEAAVQCFIRTGS